MAFSLSWHVLFWSIFIWSALAPKDLMTWFMEVAPALIAYAVLLWSRKHFPLTPMLYLLILLHTIILMVGGHYTYAEVPLFDWLAQISGGERNNFDKLGHLAQGFVPALVARELLLRWKIINGRGWLNFIIVCICLAISAFYELIEWWVAALSDEGAEAFLGTQGYVWDTQSDMLMALIGAILALLTLSRLHDKQLSNISS